MEAPMSNHSTPIFTSKSRRPVPIWNRFRVTLLGVACVAFGLLIWSRLLLVTNYPKTAIAEPQARQTTSTAVNAEPRAATADAHSKSESPLD